MANPSDERLIRNEKLLRDKNQATSQGIKKYFRNSRVVQQAPLAFACECSTLSCKKQIIMSIKEYEKLHTRNDRFIVFPGHETIDIEKIATTHDKYNVVEKFAVHP